MQYLTFDVLEVEPSYDQPARQYTRSLYTLDGNVGKIDVKDRSGVPVVRPTGFHWIMEGRTQIQVYRDFLAARKGAAVPCWVPSWTRDIDTNADLPINSTFLQISFMGYTKFFYPLPARRTVAFILPDRTKYYRKIVGAAESGPNELLTLDAPLPVLFPAHSMLCFLALCRLTSDEIELTWVTQQVADVVLDFTELTTEVPA